MEQWVITTAVTIGIGVITYFLKRTMNQVDKTTNRLDAVEHGAATERRSERFL